MPSMYGYCSNVDEIRLIRQAARDVAARIDLEAWHTELMQSLSGFLAGLGEIADMELCCVDVAPKGALHAAAVARERFAQTRMLLIAEPHMPPTEYLKPAILASALLLRPYTREQAVAVLEDMMAVLRQLDDADAFVLETKRERLIVPYRQILYFEARNRRIYLCKEGEHYPFYGTLEELTGQLPDYFIRCHKGYIVNARNVARMDYSENNLHLCGGAVIPVSRSYKSAVKELGR